MANEYNLYELGSIEELLGNEEAIQALESFSKDTEDGQSRKPLLIHGPSGIGKTAAAHLLALEHKWNVVELNASDYRDKETIERRLISASTSRTLFGKRNLIILDEIDELASGFDKGAAAAISNLINGSKSPIIFIANNMWDQNISFLRSKVEPVQFRKLSDSNVAKILSRVSKKLAIDVDKELVATIAARSNGDARSAINDLYVVMDSKRDVIEVIGMRDRKIDVFAMLDKVFYSNTVLMPLIAISNTDLSNDMLISWLDENIPKRYLYAEDMYKAFDSLSSASMFATRAVRSQYYTFWRYMNVLMSSGVALAKNHYPDSKNRYSFPSVIKELSGSKGMRKDDKTIAKKLQRYLHLSVSRIVRVEMKIVAQNIKKVMENDSKQAYESLMNTYQLEEKEVDYLVEKYK